MRIAGSRFFMGRSSVVFKDEGHSLIWSREAG
jgi:hypothetical protein